MKRWITLALALGLLLLPLSALADETVYTEGYFFYTIEDDSITITGYFGNEEEVTVPASIGAYPVNAIGPYAFDGTMVKVLYLPNTIREIGEYGTGNAEVRYIGQTQAPVNTPGVSVTPSTSEKPSTTQKPSTPKPQNTTQPGQPTATPYTDENEGELVHGYIPGDPIAETPAAPQDTPALQPEEMPVPDVTAKPEATAEALPIEAEAVEAGETPAPASHTTEPDQSVPLQPEKPQSYVWVWVLVGCVALAGAVAVVLILIKRKH